EASHLTATRQGFGTTPYMPFEQAMNAKYADGRSDIYALGATLYHLLTGVVPFPGDNHVEVVELKSRGEFKSAAALNPDVPPELDRILTRMMAREARQRYQTASELIVELERAGLAAPVPSFADPERARKDPWMQAYLASTAEPTRPDPETVPRRPLTPTPPLPDADDNGLVRVRQKGGAWRKYKATTRQVIQRLREGKMPRQVEASKAGGKFHPLSHFPEFQEITPAPKSGKRLPQRKAARSKPPPARSAALSRQAWYLFLVGGTLGAALVVVLFLYLLAH